MPRWVRRRQLRIKSCKKHPEMCRPMRRKRRLPVPDRCWSMTAIADSVATPCATGNFQRAVQFIAPGGHRSSAAEASFLTLSHAPGKGFWLALYRRLPGFAIISELVYAFIAVHRPAFYRVSVLLWGSNPEPPRYDLVSFLFLRLFGLIYLSAFISFGVQAQGLIGSHGILPVADLVDAVASSYGPERFFLMPMVFWLDASDFAIQAVCWAGAGLSILLVFNLLPRLSLFLLYVLYLSLFYGGQTFMNFQWDTFLLETGFIALLLSFATTPGIWLLRWLLFRFIFMSGVVKLLSGDPTWWNLSAFSYHFLTPSAFCCCKAAFSSLGITTGSISKPCCYACRCSMTRQYKRYCRGASPRCGQYTGKTKRREGWWQSLSSVHSRCLSCFAAW